MVGDARDRGIIFKAKIDLVESMGSEKYAYFETRGRRSSPRSWPSSPRTRAAETPSSSDEHTVVARLDAASKITRGDEAELWVDTSKLHLFDPDSGERLNG